MTLGRGEAGWAVGGAGTNQLGARPEYRGLEPHCARLAEKLKIYKKFFFLL